MILAAHRLCEPVRTEARDFLKREAWTGRDDQVVIAQFFPVIQRELGVFRIDPSDGIDEPLNAFALERRLHRHLGLFGSAPAHRDPRVRRREFEIRSRADQGHTVACRKMLAQVKSSGNAPKTCANDDNVCHKYPQLVNSAPIIAARPVKTIGLARMEAAPITA